MQFKCMLHIKSFIFNSLVTQIAFPLDRHPRCNTVTPYLVKRGRWWAGPSPCCCRVGRRCNPQGRPTPSCCCHSNCGARRQMGEVTIIHLKNNDLLHFTYKNCRMPLSCIKCTSIANSLHTGIHREKINSKCNFPFLLYFILFLHCLIYECHHHLQTL